MSIVEAHLDEMGAAHLEVAQPRPIGLVGVVGLGYVGLPSALALLSAGASVLGLDSSPSRLKAIRCGDVDLLPADIRRLRTALQHPEFVVSDDAHLLSTCDAVVICVPTPIDEHMQPDLRAITSACETVVARARAGQTIILVSTTYPGTTRQLLIEPLRARGLVAGRDIFVAFSPERIDPGNAKHVQEIVPRVVGGETLECAERAGSILCRIAGEIHHVTSPEAAEMTKLLENTFRAVNIALMHEFADAGRLLDLDVMEIVGAAATKPYGFMPFLPGAGVGGHCIPCDSHYLLWTLRERRAHAPIIEEAMRNIARRPMSIVDRAREVLGDAGVALRSARVLIVGVTYKPGVADVRETPARVIAGELLERAASVDYFDPLVPSFRVGTRELRSVELDDVESYDLLIIHTLHPQVDYSLVSRARNVLDATYQLTDVTHRIVP